MPLPLARGDDGCRWAGGGRGPLRWPVCGDGVIRRASNDERGPPWPEGKFLAFSLKRYFGKVCPKHPELHGERRLLGTKRPREYCVGCFRKKQRERDAARYAKNPELYKARACTACAPTASKTTTYQPA